MDKNLTLEINPDHQIIVKLNEMRKKDMSIGNEFKVAAVVARQILDNTMLNAGMVTDVKSVINRINRLILHVFDQHSGDNQNLKLNIEAQREEELESIMKEMETNEEFKNFQNEKAEADKEVDEIIVGKKNIEQGDRRQKVEKIERK